MKKIMKEVVKTLIVGLLGGAMIVSLVVVGFHTMDTKVDETRKLTVEVIQTTENKVISEDAEGNIWVYTTDTPVEVGSFLKLTMDTNFTKAVEDDEIIEVRY